MAPCPFRTAAVVCSIVTASLGVGLLTPVAATAATSAPSASPSAATVLADNPDFDSLPVDPSLSAPELLGDWSTPFAARRIVTRAEGDDVWMVIGNKAYDRGTGPGLFFLNLQDRFQDQLVELIRVHTAADGTQTRGERVAIPRTIRVTDLKEQNTFTPGKNHFTGTATAGALITATDNATGQTLFYAKVTDTRSGTGTWKADADLTDTLHTITLSQTTTDDKTNELRGLSYSPEKSDTPNAPTYEVTQRPLDGSFIVSGQFDDTVSSVVVEDEAGATIAEASLSPNGYSAKIPQEHIGSTVYVVGRTTDGASSPRVAVPLEQLPTDATAATPSLRSVFVHPNGRVQVVGEHDDAPGLWILDGDRVVGSVARGDAGWSYTIDAASTGKQLEMANLVFDGRDFAALSERILLPRLLQVDGVAEQNTYKPGTREFAGKAEAGATITATDQDGHELFRTEATGARSGVGTWKADADLVGTDGYEVTFTQTTTDGRTSVMRDIAFAADEDEDATPRDLTLTSHESGTFTPGPQRFTGTATPGATVTFNPAGFDPSNARYDLTTKADSSGAWTIERSLSDWQYRDAAFRQDTDGDVVKQIKSPLTPEVKDATPRDLTLTSHQSGTFAPGPQRFTGTATPGATVTFNPAGFDPSNARYDVTATANSSGVWTIERSLADWQYKDAAFRQDTDGDVVKQVKSPLAPKS